MADRSANKGKCAHCCRWHYKFHVKMKDGSVKELVINDENKDNFEYLIEEDFRPGEYYEVIEDDHGSYLLNSKDMCMMPRLNDLLRIGMDSLKVEGRNKTEYYAGVVARVYRKAIDDFYQNNFEYKCSEDMLETLKNATYRKHTTGFYLDGTINYD